MLIKKKPSSSNPSALDGGKATGSVTPELAGSDFILLERKQSQANILLFGEGGAGKTQFITHFCPEPVCLINFDGRAQGRVKEALSIGRKVYFLEVGAPDTKDLTPDLAKKRVLPYLDKTDRNFDWAISQGRERIRTIGIDTGTELSEIMEIYESREDGKRDFGKAKGQVNRRWWRMFTLAKQAGINLVVLSREKEVWKDDKPSGIFVPRPPDVLRDAADMALRISVNTTPSIKDKKAGVNGVSFSLRVQKSGDNIAELGKVYSSADWEFYGGPFAYACMKQFPNTTPEDWQ